MTRFFRSVLAVDWGTERIHAYKLNANLVMQAVTELVEAGSERSVDLVWQPLGQCGDYTSSRHW